MKRDEFKSWLIARGLTASAAATRTSAVQRIETVLRDLGDPSPDLDAAFATDGFQRLRDAIAGLIADHRDGGEAYRVLMPESEKPDSRLPNYRSWLGQYGAFLRSATRTERRSDWAALEEMRQEFLRRAPDFVDFTQTEGVYFEGERAYKDRMRERVAQIAASDADDATAGTQIGRALMPGEGPILQWQNLQSIEAAGEEPKRAFREALARLVRHQGDMTEALSETLAVLEILRDDGGIALPKGGILNIALSVAGFARPDFSCPFKIRMARGLARRLGSEPIGNGPISMDEIRSWLDLLHRIFTVMRDDWNWRPRDLFDVQGFAWMVLDDGWKPAEDESDEDHPMDQPIAAAFAPKALNTILFGPPGTGKTYQTTFQAVAICDGEAAARSLAGDDLRERYDELRATGRIGFVTFHQSYSYEDFVEGLRPEPVENGAGFGLTARPGVLRKMAETAAASSLPHVLVIDEINRANVSKVLGELITLLEEDKRAGAANAVTLRLPYSGEDFALPPNLHILGTMNTADRSIALLDTALRRRFRFIETPPRPDLLETVSGIDLRLLLEQLNARIEYLFDRDHLIGHALFMGPRDRADVDAVLRHKVIPLLAEYFHEDWERVLSILGGSSQGFIDRTLLTPPPGLDAESDAPRWRYRVRETFPEDAYAGLQA